jgi:hypothetical protein
MLVASHVFCPEPSAIIMITFFAAGQFCGKEKTIADKITATASQRAGAKRDRMHSIEGLSR